MNNYQLFSDHIRNFAIPKGRTINKIEYKYDNYMCILLDNNDLYFSHDNGIIFKKKHNNVLDFHTNEDGLHVGSCHGVSFDRLHAFRLCTVTYDLKPSGKTLSINYKYNYDCNLNGSIEKMLYFDEYVFVLTTNFKLYQQFYETKQNDLMHSNVTDIDECNDILYILTNDNTVIKYDCIFERYHKTYLQNVKQMIISNHKMLFRDYDNNVYLYENKKVMKLNISFKVIDIYITSKSQIYLLSENNKVYTNVLNFIIGNKDNEINNVNLKFVKITENIDALSKLKKYNIWNSKDHIECPIAFKKSICAFVLCLKRILMMTKIKIPKFVLFEIIKKIENDMY